MTEARLLRRHRAYFSGWAESFGEHDLLRDTRLELRWLLGAGQLGLILDPSIRTRLRGGDQPGLGGLLADEPGPPAAQMGAPRPLWHLAQAPLPATLIDVGGETLRLGRLTLRQCPPAVMDRLRQFLAPGAQLHLYEAFHLTYPAGTRILTLSQRSPLGLIYRELAPALIRATPRPTHTAPRLREAACA
jgi:hypothetical protein